MTNEQAARIFDAETCLEAQASYGSDLKAHMAAMEEACQMAAEALRKTAWISVKDRLPESYKDVLVVAFWNGKWNVYTGWCATYRGGWAIHIARGEQRNVKVSHWLPLPELPKEEIEP